MELVTAAEMRELDRAAIETRNIPSLRLMENAGKAVVEEMERFFGPLRGKAVTIVAGKGQNGGDGLVTARLLRKRRCQARVVLLASPSALTGDAATNLNKFQRARGRCLAVETPAQLTSILNPLLLDGDTGAVLGTAITATLTVTLARPKRGLYLGAGPDHAGAIRVADIGIPPDLIAAAKIPVALLEASDICAWLPLRPRTAHKGTFGHAGIIAGSAGKTGAAAMAAQAALRIGAGLVTVAAPRSVSDVLEAKLLEAMAYPVPETEARTLSKQALETLLAFAETRTALAIGPGIGTHPDTQALIHNLIVSVKRPTVLDADGINAFTGHKEMFGQAQGPLVLTPHPGEMARLLGITTADVQRDRLGVASRVAREQNVCVVLKGAGTVVAGPDGRLAVNPTGNPGMATGGTGDVLTGIITGLLAQGVTPWGAACAGVYVHGLAGDLAASETGEMGLIAGDVIRAIPLAIRRILEDNAPVR